MYKRQLYDLSGKLIRQVTNGRWEVISVKGFDATGRTLFYESTEQSPITKNLYSIDMRNLRRKKLTVADGVHTTLLSQNTQYMLDTWSSTVNPRTVQLTDLRTGRSKTILQAKNPLQDYALGELSIFIIKNSTGTDLYCRMYKPVGFDSTKKYPVIVYWYGGPHAQMIQNSWNGGSGDYWFQSMAQRGFLVFSLDTRGSQNRGAAFEQVIHRRTGQPQMEDMMDALKFLKSRPYVDDSNMGLFGWSYGGFMTTNFLLHHPGEFKAGVAGGPVMDWRMYEIMYGERYMDTPQENPEGYAATNLIKKAGMLKDRLLIIHGMQDPVVVLQHAVNFVKNAVDNNVQVDLMMYPGHQHNVSGADRAHLFQKITDYFMLHLKK